MDEKDKEYNTNLSENARVRFNAITQRIPSDAQHILNIGVASNFEGREKKGWLHGYIIENTDADVTGVSLREEEAEKLAKLGYDIRHMNGQYIDIGETFDTIVVGQVMRNFYDFGEFFRRSLEHLNDDGRIIYSLGNPHSFTEFRQAWSGDVDSKIHLSPENISRMLEFSDNSLKLKEFELLPGKAGGVSDLLWKIGLKRMGSPQYVATIEPV
jgi:SAM-dependent methyltransferase